jgi:putative ABC transport system substrate-binding protein
MKKMIKWVKIVGLLVVAVVLVACGENGTADEEEVTNIGILLSAEHGALTSAQEGFVEELEENGLVDDENVAINILNSQGNSGNLHDMAQQLASENDLLLGISTSAAQALASVVEDDTPILFTATTDPESAGLVESIEAPGGNITGTSDMVPFEEQISLLLSIEPEAERVGIIYNSSEPNSQIQADLATEAIEASGREAVIMTVTSTNDVQQVATSLMNEVDAIYIPTDNTLSSAATTVGELAIEHQIPIVAGSIDHTAEGGLATYGINYNSLGRQTGQMALNILENETAPADIAVETAQELDLFVNEEMAEALGIDPESIQLEE